MRRKPTIHLLLPSHTRSSALSRMLLGPKHLHTPMRRNIDWLVGFMDLLLLGYIAIRLIGMPRVSWRNGGTENAAQTDEESADKGINKT